MQYGTIILDMSIGNWISVSGILIPILGTGIFLIYRSGAIAESIANLTKSTSELKERLKDFPVHARMVEKMWEKMYSDSDSDSPLTLYEKGRRILEESRIGEFTNRRYAEILERVSMLRPTNSYEAQNVLFGVMRQYRNEGTCKTELEQRAFMSGEIVEALLFVGGLNIRDRVLKDLGFDLDDLDEDEKIHRK